MSGSSTESTLAAGCLRIGVQSLVLDSARCSVESLIFKIFLECSRCTIDFQRHSSGDSGFSIYDLKFIMDSPYVESNFSPMARHSW